MYFSFSSSTSSPVLLLLHLPRPPLLMKEAYSRLGHSVINGGGTQFLRVNFVILFLVGFLLRFFHDFNVDVVRTPPPRVRSKDGRTCLTRTLPTNGPTDQRTNGWTSPLIEADADKIRLKEKEGEKRKRNVGNITNTTQQTKQHDQLYPP